MDEEVIHPLDDLMVLRDTQRFAAQRIRLCKATLEGCDHGAEKRSAPLIVRLRKGPEMRLCDFERPLGAVRVAELEEAPDLRGELYDDARDLAELPCERD